MATNLKLNNDGYLVLTKLKRKDTGAYINDAAGTWTISKDGVDLTGANGSMVASGSGGNYSAKIESSVFSSLLSVGDIYTITVVMSSGGIDFEFTHTDIVTKRRAE